jgi:predicted patatin/cPLA2 family phospholipase
MGAREPPRDQVVTPILEQLLVRARRGNRAPHADGISIALAVEGGAMRGVISAGMVSALEDLGLTSAFDAVYGSSAGAINAAYFLAGQAKLGTTIYYEDINNRRFIDLRRPLRGQPIVDLGYLLDEVAQQRKPLMTARVLDAESPLSVMATDVDAESAYALRQFQSPAALFSALRAGATMPVIAGGPRDIEGRRLLDASLSEPIPVTTAEIHGHTHIVVLLTRGGAMRPQPSAFDRYFVAPRLRRLSPSLAHRYLTRAIPYADVMRAIEGGSGPLGRSEVLGIRVADFPISKLECRADILRAGAKRGYDAVMTAFGQGN